MDEEPKDVFVCYNKADVDLATQLATRIESETIDGKKSSRNLSVFFAEWDIDLGENTINRMNEGLKLASKFMPVLSPEFFKSGWTNFEWTHIVSADPVNVQKRIIPLIVRDKSIDGTERLTLPAPFGALKFINFQNGKTFERNFEILLRRIRGLRPERGGPHRPRYSGESDSYTEAPTSAWHPDEVDEILLSNLLKVHSMPQYIYCGETQCKSSYEIHSTVNTVPPHLVKEGKVWTFEDLRNTASLLRPFVDISTIESTNTSDCLKDEKKLPWMVELLNKCLRQHLTKLAIKLDKYERFFFRPNKDGTDRVWTIKGSRSRAVASRKTVESGGFFWVHHAAYLKFVQMEGKFYLRVQPTFMFTSDGDIPVDGQQMGKLSFAWGGRQRNPDILRGILFWLKVMSLGKRFIPLETGGQVIKIDSSLVEAKISKGIEGDSIKFRSLLDEPDDELDEVLEDIDIHMGDQDEEPI